MIARSSAWRDALDLWAVRFLTTFSWRLRVRTFLLGFAVVSAGAAAAGAVLAFISVTAISAALLTVSPSSGAVVAWGTVIAVAGMLLYTIVGALLREAFSRVRYTIPASPLRGLWIALDLPLRQVIAAERGSEQLPRALVAGGVVVGTASALAASGAPALAVIAAVASLGIVIAGEGVCHLVAVRAATTQPRRRLPAGLGEAYVAVLGLAVGAALPGVVRLLRGVDTGAALDAVTGASASALQAGALVTVGVGVALAGVTCVAIARQPPRDVPLLGIDAPALVATRPTLWGRARRSTWCGAVAWGTGSMTPQPAVTSLFRMLVGAAALAAGAWLADGPVLAGLEVRGIRVDDVVATGAALVAATLASFVTAATVFVAGHSARLWHYRTLREMGGGVLALWSGHIVGAVVQCAAYGLALTVGLGALTGRVRLEIVLLTIVVALADHLADSLFARPSRDAGEGTGSTATAVVGMALVAPALVVALVGGLWVWAGAVYVVVLAGGGLWCFEVRSRNIPVVVVGE